MPLIKTLLGPLASDMTLAAERIRFTGDDFFDNPGMIATDGVLLYKTDPSANEIIVRNASDLTHVARFGSFGQLAPLEFYGPLGMCVSATHLFICDSYNMRIVKIDKTTFAFVAEVCTRDGEGLPVEDPDYTIGFKLPRNIATDGTYLYIIDQWNGIIKRRCSDLGYEAQHGILGAFAAPQNNNFYYGMQGIATDGTFVYVGDNGYNRFKKLNASNLTYNSQAAMNADVGYGVGFSYTNQLSTDGSVLYDCTQAGSPNCLVTRNCSNFAQQDFYIFDSDMWDIALNSVILYSTHSDCSLRKSNSTSPFAELLRRGISSFMGTPKGMCTDNTYVYYINRSFVNSTWHIITKIACADLGFVAHCPASFDDSFGGSGGPVSGSDFFRDPYSITYYAGYLYVADYVSVGNPDVMRVIKFNKDLVWINTTALYLDGRLFPLGGIHTDGTHLYVTGRGIVI